MWCNPLCSSLILMAFSFLCLLQTSGCRVVDDVLVVFPGNTLTLAEQRIQPADTGAGIDLEPRDNDYHQVVLPLQPNLRKPIAVVYMVGSLGTPGNATEIGSFIASLGYGVLNLRYPSNTVVGVACMERDACFAETRGETIFGENVAYRIGHATYNEPSHRVTLANSIISRVVNLLDFLAHQEPSELNPEPGYWRQFLLRDANSPYSTPNLGGVYPNWSQIVVAGHSQGGGMAAMLAMNLLPSDPPRRVVMLSSPNDNTGRTGGNRSASWVIAPSATPMDRFWGLRHSEDTGLGGYVAQNWQNMGGETEGGVGGIGNNAEFDVGDGSVDPMGARRLVLTAPVESASDGHASTANPEYVQGISAAWTYLFTAGGTD